MIQIIISLGIAVIIVHGVAKATLFGKQKPIKTFPPLPSKQQKELEAIHKCYEECKHGIQ